MAQQSTGTSIVINNTSDNFNVTGVAMGSGKSINLGTDTQWGVSVSAAGLVANATATAKARVTTDIPLIVQGAASQSGNLQQWKNSSGTVLSAIDSNGNVGIGTTSPGYLLSVDGSGIQSGIEQNGARRYASKTDLADDTGVSSNTGKWYMVFQMKQGTWGTSVLSGHVLFGSPWGVYDAPVVLNVRKNNTTPVGSWSYSCMGSLCSSSSGQLLQFEIVSDGTGDYWYQLYAYSPSDYASFETVLDESDANSGYATVINLPKPITNVTLPDGGTVVAQSTTTIFPSGNVGLDTTCPLA